MPRVTYDTAPQKQKAEPGTGNQEPGKTEIRSREKQSLELKENRNLENHRAFPSPWDFRVPDFFYAFAVPGSGFRVPPLRLSGFRFLLF
jgi:hypothetical protein